MGPNNCTNSKNSEVQATRISRQAVGALHPGLSVAIQTLGLTRISEEIMQNYEYNTQKTWKTNSKYAKVNRRS